MQFIRVFVGSCAVGCIASALYHRPVAAADEHMAHMSAADIAAPQIINLNEQGTPGIPASANTAAARLKVSNRHSEWVKIPWEAGSKDSLMAWVVYPSTTSAKTPVVVVVQEIFGLSTWVRGVADQAAADGFIAIAPDVFSRARGGPSADEITGDSARKLSGMPTAAEKNAAVAASAKYAMSLASAAPRYAVIGYCWGGSVVWGHAINGGTTGYAGGVAFYGTPYMTGPVPNADSLAKIKMPLMLLGGATDRRIAAAMPAIDSIMKSMKKDYLGMNYDGAAHGFLRLQDDKTVLPATASDSAIAAAKVAEAANLAAAKDAWPRTLAFLNKNLKGIPIAKP